MSFEVTCPAGHRLMATDEYRGKRVGCPVCQTPVEIPLANQTAAPQSLGPLQAPATDSLDPLQSPATSNPMNAASSTPPQQQVASAASTREANATAVSGPNYTLVALVGAASAGVGMLLAMLVLLVLYLAFSPSKSAVASNPTVAPDPSSHSTDSAPSTPSTSQAKTSAEYFPLAEPDPMTVPPAPAVPTVSSAFREDDTEVVMRKLKQVGLAVHRFADKHNGRFSLPRALDSITVGTNSKPGTELSWRVHILPYLDQQPLYDKFNLDEPWDSPHNQPLAASMPDVFAIGKTPDAHTRIQIITGKDFLIGPERPPGFRNIDDGLSNTIMAVLVGPDRAAPWTKPDTLIIDGDGSLKPLGDNPNPYIFCIRLDAKVLPLPRTISHEDFRAFATLSGGESTSGNSLLAQYEAQQQAARFAKLAASATTKTIDPASTPDAKTIQVNLKKLSLALNSHVASHPTITQPVSSDPAEHWSKLSWRVHLLPLLGYQSTYRKFKFNEAWDSPHNLKAAENMPTIFHTGGRPGHTSIRVFTGPKMLFGDKRVTSRRDVRDGATNTISMVAVSTADGVPWTKPEFADLTPEPGAVQRIVGNLEGTPLHCVLLDTEVLALPSTTPIETIVALATPSGGETVDGEGLRSAHRIDVPVPPEFMLRLRSRVTNRISTGKSLKTLTLGMQNYTDSFRSLPPGQSCKVDENGDPLLSWRVHLLPMIGYDGLHKKFKLDEPWDSDHNKELLKFMPAEYRLPEEPLDTTTTRVLTLTGPDALFSQKVASSHNPRDGSTHTLQLVTAGKEYAVPWTKPQDFEFDIANPTAVFGAAPDWLIHVTKMDGAVHHVKSSIPSTIFKIYVTPNGREKVPGEAKYFGLGR